MADARALNACQLAEQALMAMHSRGIPPTPENFAVWYQHLTGSNPALGRAITTIEQSPGGFTAERSAELHRQYVVAEDSSRHLEQVSSRINGVVDEVSKKLGLATSQTRDYSERLSSLGHGISSVIDPGEFVALVRELENQTELMRQRASKLEVELERNSREMSELRGDLENARRAATTDPLTGLGNRKLFDDVFAEEAEEVLATGAPLSLLVIDIDHFKSFNDRHGHQVGDAVLKLVADRLKRAVKGRDTVARYGGEEFVILLPRTDEAAAAQLADQLRAEIAKSRLVVRNSGQDLGKVTISIGVAQYQAAETPADCFKTADHALYNAKHAGRNRVVTASDAAEMPEEPVAA